MIPVKCTNCGQVQACFEGLAGLTVQCKSCLAWMRVPGETDSTAPTSDEANQTDPTAAAPVETGVQIDSPANAYSAEKQRKPRAAPAYDEDDYPDISRPGPRARGILDEQEIVRLTGLTVEDFQSEMANGARFVIYSYCISIIVLTFRQASPICFVRSNGSRFLRGLPYTMISLTLGWWGFPWGLIYTIGCVAENAVGGVDVTDDVMAALQGHVPDRYPADRK